MIKKLFKSSYLLLVLLFIYLPITILIFFSFNDERSLSVFNGSFSLVWYKNFLADRPFIESIISSLLVAIISTIVSVVIGTLAAIGISKAKKVTQTLTLNVSNIPLINADVVTAVSLMMLFMALSFKFGLLTLILAHISFNIPYVIITVLPGLRRIHPSIVEASLDLGASPQYTLRKVILPLILPAIIASAVISFAMSFDDFIISYFTGGSVTNVATHIYTLKKITPIVNVFGTLLVLLVVLMVLSWNFYTIITSHINSRNQDILKEKYRAKEIVKGEKKLLFLYLQLNNVAIEKQINIRKLKRKIFNLEIKIERERLWIKTKKAQILRKDRRQEKASMLRREKYYWLIRWPWKAIAITALAFTSLGTLTFAYVKTNLYDLKLGIWGEYTSPEIISAFEKKYNIRIKEENYDKNEVLYNKMLTTYYDIIVPSDYMGSRFIKEGKVEKIDWSKLSAIGNLKSENKNCNLDSSKPVNSLWQYMDCNVKESLTSSIYTNEAGKLSDYAVPYFWGDLVMLINFEKPENEKWLKEQGGKILTTKAGKKYIDPQSVSWELLWTAARAGKNVYALSDHRSLYGVAFQLINQTVNARSIAEVDYATDHLLYELIVTHKKNVTLKGDMMAIDVGAPYDANSKKAFDIGVMYNGDAIASFFDKDENIQSRDFQGVRPRKAISPIDVSQPIQETNKTSPKQQGTNIWIDSAMISKGSRNKDLAYKFLQFVLQDKIQKELSLLRGYNTPIIKAGEEIVKDEMAEIQDIYLPVSTYDTAADKWISQITIADGGFEDRFIADITDRYNRKINANLG